MKFIVSCILKTRGVLYITQRYKSEDDYFFTLTRDKSKAFEFTDVDGASFIISDLKSHDENLHDFLFINLQDDIDSKYEIY